MVYRLVFLLILIIISNSAQAQRRGIIIEIKTEKSIIDSPRIVLRNIDSLDLSENQSLLPKIYRDGTIKWSIETERPVELYINGLDDIFGDFNAIMEPGDSVFINQNSMGAEFSGRGFEKLKVLYDIYKSRRHIKPLKNNSDLSKSLGDYFEASSYISARVAQVEDVLDTYKQVISPFAYSYLRATLIFDLETRRIHKFHSLWQIRDKFGIAIADLIRIYDTTIANSSAAKIIREFQESSIVVRRDFLFYYNRIACMRENHFARIESIEDFIIEYYYFANRNFEGVMRESLLSFILTSRLIREIGFTNKVEVILEEYYSRLGNNQKYISRVREFEVLTRKRRLESGRQAPELELIDPNGTSLTLRDFKGKLILIDFNQSHCYESISMEEAIRKVRHAFKDNPNVMFLTISFDTSRSQSFMGEGSVKPVLIREGINSYTAKAKSSSALLRRFAIDSFPYLHLIDQSGRVLVNPVPDPRSDGGENLTKIMQKYLWRGLDGPYVLYRDMKTIAKSIKLSNKSIPKLDSIVFGKGRRPLIAVNTDEYGKVFYVQLKNSIAKESSSFSMPARMLILSDIEGNFDVLKKMLQSNKVIDSLYNWIFDDGHLAFNGDIFDRGDQVTECLWLIYYLEEKAKLKGGHVHYILGNHEIMNMKGDTRYVHPKYINSASILNEEHKVLFGKNSEIGRWLRSKNIMEKIGDLLLVHGGVTKEINSMGMSLAQMNDLAQQYYGDVLIDSTNVELLTLFNSHTSPFWYRNYYENDGDSKKATVGQIDSTLTKFGVSRIVTGHTIVADTISTHYNGKVINIDTKHKEGKSEALLIENDHYYRVGVDGEKRVLFKKQHFF